MQQTLFPALDWLGLRSFVPAGRTDRGVHARMQVVSVRAPAELANEEIERALSAELPRGAMGIVASRAAAADFNARWSTTAKAYRYRLALAPPAPAWAPFAWDVLNHPRLAGARFDLARFADLLGRAVGARDFWAFHDKSSPRRIRRLERAEVVELGAGLIDVRLRGDAFARYQVRYLVGNAALAAAGLVSEAQFLDALERAVELPGMAAPAHALVAWEVVYPPERDPFSASERRAAAGVPEEPPFTEGPGPTG